MLHMLGPDDEAASLKTATITISPDSLRNRVILRVVA